MEATTLIRAAGSGPLSAAEDMPRGKPIETPTAHRATPMRMIQGFPATMNSAIPTTPRAVVRRTVRTRPRRSTTGPANSRVIPSLAAKTVKNNAAMAALCPWATVRARGEPVVGGALAELAPEHDHADEQQPPVQPAAQPLAQPRGPV